jgi:hypothetical protein
LTVRYKLRDRRILQWIMQHPGRGTPYTIRSLAREASLSTSLIGHLHSGHRDDVDMVDAHNIAEALGVAILVLFAPPSSPEHNDPSIN